MRTVYEKENTSAPVKEIELPVISDAMSGLRVLGVAADQNACAYYRVINPLRILKQHGATVGIVGASDVKNHMSYDVFLLPRQYSLEVLETTQFLLWEGKFPIYELDDDLHHVLRDSPAYRAFKPGSPNVLGIEKFISSLHGATVTTPELARWMSQFQQNLAIVENMIDFSLRDWNCEVAYMGENTMIQAGPRRRIEGTEGRIVVGWQGGQCYDDQTEILTEHRGFQLFRDLNKDERVATLNRETDTLEYQQPTEYFDFPFEGELNVVETKDVNYAVTPNHWMYVSRAPRRDWEELIFENVQSEDITKNSYHVITETLSGGLHKYVIVEAKDHQEVTYNGRVYCVTVPNHLLYVRRKGKPLVCGNTHWPDLKTMGPSISKVMKQRSNIMFALYCNETHAKMFVETFNLPADRVLHISPTDFTNHPTRCHGIDISLSPLLGCQFNLAKSNLKNLEGLAAGSAVVASHVGPYARFARRHPGTIFTVGKRGSHETWEDAILTLVDNPQLLEQKQIEGKALVINQYSLERNYHLWPRAWAAIAERSRRGILGPPDKRLSPEKYLSWGMYKKTAQCPCGSGKQYFSCCGPDGWG